MKTDAYLSDDRRYRYWLLREWDISLPVVAFIGVNPSTADERKDDATIRKEIGFAKRWGFGAVLALNVGAYRSTDPRTWRKAWDAIGQYNSAEHLAGYIQHFRVSKTIAAWGKNGNYYSGRCDAIIRTIPDLHCLGRNSDGSPRHPLMIAYATPMERFGVTQRTSAASGD